MTNPRSVLVVGGGVVGLSSALALRERGLDVLLVDEAPERPPASWGNIGHIATEQVAPLASWPMVLEMPRRLMLVGGPVSFPPTAIATWLPFGLRLLAAGSPARFAAGKAALSALLGQALPAWRDRAATLPGPELLKETGHLVVWESPASAARGRRGIGVPVTEGVTRHEATARQSADLSTAIARPLAGAMRYAGTGSVADPGAVLSALRLAFVEAGGRVECGRVDADRLARRETDLVVIAAGVRSKPLMRAIGHAVPIVAERGYHIQSAAAAQAWPEDLPPVVFEDRALVVARFASGLRATSFVEFTRPDAPPDPRKWARLHAHVAELGLTFGADTTTWHGSRPTLPDYLPAIGVSSKDRRVIYAFGHQHLGLTLGPITGRIVADLATGETPQIDLAAFAIDRFARRRFG
ncbi:MAG: FAD-binding oxidoreductase [Phyllobacteriaceae bacterium]|nr:FAD-binding oxidoreductase [Phyllobacteriaceae bacterium]